MPASSSPLLPPHLQELKDNLPPFISVEKSMEVHACSSHHIYDLIAADKIEAVKMGRRTLIVTATLLAELASLPSIKVKPTPTPKSRRKAAAETATAA